jgi:hypothetical protein
MYPKRWRKSPSFSGLKDLVQENPSKPNFLEVK